MAYLPELHYCQVCGKDLGAENGDGICGDCDELICDDRGALMLLQENYAICPECGNVKMDDDDAGTVLHNTGFASLRDMVYTECPCGCGFKGVCETQLARTREHDAALSF